MKRICAPLLAAFLFGIGTGAHAQRLKAGDRAPAIKVAKWVKGTPLKAFAPGRVAVVEFWATWCGPCRETIPHLTELARKYRGRAAFAGVSVQETQGGEGKSTAYYGTVARFVKRMGAQMDYNVGIDGPQGAMQKTWLLAAGRDTLPTAFVVDKGGKIAWIGHPLELDGIIEKVLTGSLDVKAEAARQAQVERERAEAGRAEKALERLDRLAEARQYRLLLAEISRFQAAHPRRAASRDLARRLALLRFAALLRVDAGAAPALARELASGPFRDDAEALNELAGALTGDGVTLDPPGYEAAALLAGRAAELTRREDPTVLHTLAYALFKKGDRPAARAAQEAAIRLLEGAPGAQARELLAEYRARLEKMKP